MCGPAVCQYLCNRAGSCGSAAVSRGPASIEFAHVFMGNEAEPNARFGCRGCRLEPVACLLQVAPGAQRLHLTLASVQHPRNSACYSKINATHL
eukprot:361250-Chlamydomonas_euryale.AAC.24